MLGQKKRHTAKFQVVIDRESEQIVCTGLFNGNAHDLAVFKATTPVNPRVTVYGDSGYRGMKKVHPNAKLPVRHKEDLAKLGEAERAAQKAENKAISSVRMKIEHIIGRIKVFKIVAEKYRNRLKRLLLRFNLICGIVNHERLAKG